MPGIYVILFLDFGNYTCHSENSVGERKESVIVSGEPHAAEITSDKMSTSSDSYRLEWKVATLFKIEECRILYRQVDEDMDWTNIIPTLELKQREKYSFNFHQLKEDTDYDVIVQTRNREGWSEPSNIFTFSTIPSKSKYDPAQFRRSIFSSTKRQTGEWILLIFVNIIRQCLEHR